MRLSFLAPGLFRRLASAGGSITFVGGKTMDIPDSSGTNTTVSLTDLTGGLAAAPAENDFVLVAYANGSAGDDNLSVVTAGYTEIAEPWGNDTDDVNLSVSRKHMSGSPDTEVVVGPTGFAGRPGVVIVHVYRGVNLTTPMDVTATTATGIDGSAVNPPSITPVTSGAKIVVAGAQAFDGTMTAFSATDLDNFRQEEHNASAQFVRGGMGSKDWTSGAYDPPAWTGGTTNAAAAWAAVTVALRPA